MVDSPTETGYLLTLRLILSLPLFLVSLVFLAIGAATMFIGDGIAIGAKWVSGEK